MLRCFREDIVIASPTPQIEKFPICLNIQNILRRDRISKWRRSSIHRRIRWQKAVPRLTGFDEVVPNGERGISQFTIDIQCQILGRGVSAVAPCWSEAPIMLASDRVERVILRNYIDGKYEGPLIRNESFASQLGLPTSSDPESAGECSNHNSRNSCEACAVEIKKSSGTLSIHTDLGVEIGRTFIRRVIAAATIVPAYAALKSWRERTLSNQRHG